ncbi:XRE family transcriptional regulator [Williamsia sp.]|uniref:XRE family transcriptional regulator n=1 Tax=Williamsia sp. TaxID=1872085 RepID=UPI001A264910|nr:XRE family transcriptional regulator [Williamsia sp.]MBJ7291658.1 XRE family transcriptional regulator [Williamsia sp.]
MAADNAQPTKSFADCLNELFDTVRDEHGRPYSAKKTAKKAHALGYHLSDAYISQMRSGKVLTPSFRVAEALARSFEVSVTRFLADPDADLERVQRQREYFALAGKPNVRRSAELHGFEFSTSTVDAIIRLLNSVKKHRGTCEI